MSNYDEKSISGKSGNKSNKIKNLEDLIKAAAASREDDINPERKLLFRPKIYESWKDGDEEDELEVRRRLLTDIANKQVLLAEKKSFMSVEEDDEDIIGEKKHLEDTILRLKNRKQREAAFKDKIAKYELKTTEERLRKEQEIFESERANPSKYGFFYGDGYYEGSGYFGIKEELIEQLAEEGEEWNEKWMQKYPETFTEKFLRHFWPPKLLIKNHVFRTRGSYLDFPEVIADWPKPIDITYNRSKVEMLSSSLPIFTPNEDGELMEIGLVNEFLRKAAEAEAAIAAQEAAEAEELRRLAELEKMEQETIQAYGIQKKSGESIFAKKGKVGPKTDLGADEWYYDDELGEFFPKRLGFEIEYHFDGNSSVWRRKRKKNKADKFSQSPYDYYWDSEVATFLPRAEYQGIHTIDYDDTLSVYKLTRVVKQKVGDRSVRVVTESDKTEFKVPDFYYNENTSKWDLKTNAEDGSDIAWDENGKRFALKSEGSWRGLTGHSPDDYYFDDTTGKFIPKPPRQGNNFKYNIEDGVWKKANPSHGHHSRKNIKSSDYFFDLLEGQFKLREVGKDSRYEYQKYAKIYFKAIEPKSGLYPEDYYWDPKRKLWLPRQIRMEMLQNAKSAVPYVVEKGKITNTSNSQQEKFFWDSEEGEYFKKEPRESYYFDKEADVWLSEKLKNKVRNRKYANDYYWNETKKNFVLKDPKASDTAYTFDDKEGVWKAAGTATKSGNPRPKDFVFDADAQTWVPIGNAGGEANAMTTKKSSTIKTPNEFWLVNTSRRLDPSSSPPPPTRNIR